MRLKFSSNNFNMRFDWFLDHFEYEFYKAIIPKHELSMILSDIGLYNSRFEVEITNSANMKTVTTILLV